jgi:glutathione peroxidase
MSDLYDIPLTLGDGTATDFGRFRGRTVLVVNVASKCGFTPQYEGLERLYGQYRERGFEILGVPCNQFAGQEPGTDEEISEFCTLTYGVSFPLLRKADVRGRNQHPLYERLTAFRTGILPGLIKWNFEKFLIGADGVILDRFASTVAPESPEITAAIESSLREPAG